jgi:hypothetical protein
VNVVNSSQTQTQNRPTLSQTLHHIHQWFNFALKKFCSIKSGWHSIVRTLWRFQVLLNKHWSINYLAPLQLEVNGCYHIVLNQVISQFPVITSISRIVRYILSFICTSVACAVGPKCYHVLNWFFLPKPDFLEFIWISSSRNYLKINISHILNPNLTK